MEHVFGAQENALGGRFVRTIGIVRARAKIALANLAYNHPTPRQPGADGRRMRAEPARSAPKGRRAGKGE